MLQTPAHELIAHFARASHDGDLLASHRNAYGLLAIGYDHTDSACEGQRIDAARADELLEHDVARIRDQIVLPKLPPRVQRELSDNQIAALVSFAHSISRKVWADSCVWARVATPRYIDVPGEMLKHCRHDGRTLRVLTRRRLSEANLFCSFPGWLVMP